jgi:TRAP-type C4-dicarboxylate transport system substrate-binding protein
MYDEWVRDEREALGFHNFACAYNRGPYWPFTKFRPIYTIEDWKGLTINSTSIVQSQMYEALGAIPLFFGSAEVYENLAKGVIDAGGQPVGGLVTRKWYETGKPGYYHDWGAIYLGVGQHFMNLEVYQSLPKDLQEVIDEAGRNYTNWLDDAYDVERKEAMEFLVDYGTEIIIVSDSEKQRLQDIKHPILVQWAEELEAVGDPGLAMLDALYETSEQCVKDFPLKPSRKEIIEAALAAKAAK